MRSARRAIASLLATVTLLPAAAHATTTARAGVPHPSAHRAAVSYAALEQWFATKDGSGLYHEQYPVEAADNAHSYEWPYSQAHVATLDLTAMKAAGSRYDAALAKRDAAQLDYWHDAGATGLPARWRVHGIRHGISGSVGATDHRPADQGCSSSETRRRSPSWAPTRPGARPCGEDDRCARSRTILPKHRGPTE